MAKLSPRFYEICSKVIHEQGDSFTINECFESYYARRRSQGESLMSGRRWKREMTSKEERGRLRPEKDGRGRK